MFSGETGLVPAWCSALGWLRTLSFGFVSFRPGFPLPYNMCSTQRLCAWDARAASEPERLLINVHMVSAELETLQKQQIRANVPVTANKALKAGPLEPRAARNLA